MKRIMFLLLLLVVVSGCASNVQDNGDMDIEEVEEEELSQELGQDIEDYGSFEEDAFANEDLEGLESDLEGFEW